MRDTHALELADGAVYTPEQIAAWAKCSPSLVRKHLRERVLKGHRPGGSSMWRVKGSDAKAWLESPCTKSDLTNSDASTPEGSIASPGQRERGAADTSSTLASIDQYRKRKQP